MTKKNIVILVAAVVTVGVSVLSLVNSCNYSQSSAKGGTPAKVDAVSSPKDSDNFSEIYEAVLTEKFPKGTHVTGETKVGLFTKTFSEDTANLDISPQLVESYNVANQTVLAIKKTEILGSTDYPLLSDDTKDNSQTNRPITATSHRGVVTFSAIGFSDDRSKALVSISFACGSFCGYGKFYFLVRSGRGWKILWDREVWIA